MKRFRNGAIKRNCVVREAESCELGTYTAWLRPLSMFWLIQVASQVRYVVADQPMANSLVDAIYEFTRYVKLSNGQVQPRFQRLCAAVIYHIRWQVTEVLRECYGTVGTIMINSTYMAELDYYIEFCWPYNIRTDTDHWRTQHDERITLLMHKILLGGIPFFIDQFKDSYEQALMWFDETIDDLEAQQEWTEFLKFFQTQKLKPNAVSDLLTHVRIRQMLVNLSGDECRYPSYYNADCFYELACVVLTEQGHAILPETLSDLPTGFLELKYTQVDSNGKLWFSKNRAFGFALVGGE